MLRRPFAAGSGRLSFSFALKGPALSVDTACSSSLVAAHLVAGYMARGVSSAGIAAGVGLLLSPSPTAMFQKVRNVDTACWDACMSSWQTCKQHL